MHDDFYDIPADIPSGLYLMQGLNGKETASVKIVIK